ncbi:MAG: hypothetical protein LBD34_00665 [Puniceicoccales bacterium]|jgi:hypothetical protein|nr:hypothetical protein [Puniceicoccales bacterium]
MHASKTDSGKFVTKKETNVNTSRPDTVKRPAVGISKQNSKTLLVVARANIGFGNRLYIRGDGCGLSWDKGIEMKCTNDDCWQWEFKDVSSKTNLEFKVLINDEIWSTGENYTASSKNNEVCPTF